MTAIALLTECRYVNPPTRDDDWYGHNVHRDDHYLQKELRALGYESERLDWADPNVDWNRFDTLVFRTTWDYFQRPHEFSRWLQSVSKQGHLINDAAQIQWNMDKHYLADLEKRGVPIVPCHFIESASRIDLQTLLTTTSWSDAVIKPTISGAARHTYRVDHQNAAQLQPTIDHLLETESFIFQPFMASIAEGELSLMVFDGKYSHAVRKVPKAGDFRVQDDHGGKVHSYQPTPREIEFAERAVAACDTLPAYGRVDIVENAGGELELMELELIEPELWLRHHPPAAKAFAEAIARRL